MGRLALSAAKPNGTGMNVLGFVAALLNPTYALIRFQLPACYALTRLLSGSYAMVPLATVAPMRFCWPSSLPISRRVPGSQ